ncbi:hypothetical protein JAO73_15265 [Hymenobacter sp. BT523]|uniref:hypothetical protein n=1 Tax=Hymenobacter sp. BT523 TaxID=2795725 RepID=UPI0018EAF4A7|nr:hypothetical protein [Hymenobacter sp. BT523]MBJ6110382.1 hypothetical protein [Hymenobacter sp. BT523]
MKYTLLFLLLLGRLHLEQPPRPSQSPGRAHAGEAPPTRRPALAALVPLQSALPPPHAR